MGVFNVNFRDLVNQIAPHFLRKDEFLRLLFSKIKPLTDINNDGVIVESFGQVDSSLYQFTLFINNFLNFDARTIFLEKFLNQVYDPVNEGIVIVNDNTTHVQYLFNDAEQKPDVFMYNQWDATISYVDAPEDFVFEDNVIYKANAASLNKQPPNASFWDVQGPITFLFNFDDVFPFDYRIDIPLSITGQTNYSNERIKSQINLFNSAGRTYQGVQKGNITNVFFDSIT